MAVVRRDPTYLEPWMPSRLFDRLLRWSELPWGDAEIMKIEELREGDELVVRAEMPGIDPDKDVEISVEHHVLTIRAERRQEEKVEEKGRSRSEFRYGSFTRSIGLPIGAAEDDVKATYTDGILEVRVPLPPVPPESGPKQVTVTRA